MIGAWIVALQVAARGAGRGHPQLDRSASDHTGTHRDGGRQAMGARTTE